MLYNERVWRIAEDRYGKQIISDKQLIRHKGDSRPVFGCLFTNEQSNKDVLFINSWLPHGSQYSLKNELENALENIYQFVIEKRGRQPTAVVMTGDFNEYFESGRVPLEIQGLGDLKHARTEQESSVTWHTRNRSVDNVLYWSGAYTETKSEIGKNVTSDHKPVECTIWL